MSLKVVVSVSREFVGVKEMYSWVSSAYVQMIFEGFFEITEEELFRE